MIRKAVIKSVCGFLFFFVSFQSYGEALESCQSQIGHHKGPKTNSGVSSEVWVQVAPLYLMPENHPIKERLDVLFSTGRVILSLETLRKAGFSVSKPRKFTHLITATHPDFPGYFFKIYLDAQRYYKEKPEYVYWIMRATGAQMVRDEIQANGWEDLFKAPVKWIYALPEEPAPPPEFLRKNFILVEEDMDLYSTKENNALWKSDIVSKERLDALYYLLKTIGLRDCAKPDNVPFSLDGRVAFVDTQSYLQDVPFKDFAQYLYPENKEYWKQLIRE